MLNESDYQRQSDNYQQMSYMQTAFGGVMADKKNKHKVSSNFKKLKPKRMFNYSMESDKEVIDDITGIEQFMKKQKKKS